MYVFVYHEYSFLFIASFAFVLQRLRAKPIPLKMNERIQRLPCVKGAVALATEGLYPCYLGLFYNPSVSLRLPPPFTQGRLFVGSIISQIGKENKFSAGIFVLLILR